MKLEDVTAGVSLEGVEPSHVVTVVAAIRIPPDSVQLIYRLPDGTLRERLVEPLPHQITAVYESMLPRQPLRFVLADGVASLQDRRREEHSRTRRRLVLRPT